MISYSTQSSAWPDIQDVKDSAELELKQLMGDIFRTAVQLSPVYSGAYRASWRVSYNYAREDVTNGRTNLNPIRGAAFRWPPGFKWGDTVIISNNQPYAELIEYGWSSQAPFGVLRVATLLAT